MIWVHVSHYDELAPRIGKTVRYKGKEVALFRLADGGVKAVENRCPHKGGVLAEGIVSDTFVFCPMHDRKIDLGSGLVQAPDTGCVRTYPASVVDGNVFVSFADKEERASESAEEVAV